VAGCKHNRRQKQASFYNDAILFAQVTLCTRYIVHRKIQSRVLIIFMDHSRAISPTKSPFRRSPVPCTALCTVDVAADFGSTLRATLAELVARYNEQHSSQVFESTLKKSVDCISVDNLETLRGFMFRNAVSLKPPVATCRRLCTTHSQGFTECT
jgi:hypothetical protein